MALKIRNSNGYNSATVCPICKKFEDLTKLSSLELGLMLQNGDLAGLVGEDLDINTINQLISAEQPQGGQLQQLLQHQQQQQMQQHQQQQQMPGPSATITSPQQRSVQQPGASASRPSQQRNQRTKSSGSQSKNDGIYVEIVEQPRQRGLRFRYECEGRSAGSIPGEKSTPEKKTFPTIKIINYCGTAVIVVSCVTKDQPYEPHPHNLVGRDCKRGVCTLKVKDTNVISFPHLGIQCAKKKDVEGNLKQRQEINVDPFQSGFKHLSKINNIDLNVVRLCFQVFLPDESGKITRIIPPVVSHPIHDKKSLNELVICRIDKSSGKAKGGDEVFLLCEKINRDDIGIRFYLEGEDGNVEWEDFADFSANDIHRQYAIVFKTPPYKDPYITRPVEVKMQLKRMNDAETSEPIPFIYMPEDPDPDRIHEKRKRKADQLKHYGIFADGSMSGEDIKQRLKIKATKSRIKQEAESPEIPTYSYTNTGAMSVNPVSASGFTMDTSQSAASVNIHTMDKMAMGNVTVTNQPKSTMSMEQVKDENTSIPFHILRQLAMVKMQQEAALKQQQQQQQQQQALSTSQAAGSANFEMTNYATQSTSSGGVVYSDVSMQQAAALPTQDNQPTVDLAMLQQYLGEQGATNVSFESLDGLSGNLMNLEYDPNIGAMENVSTDAVANQRQIDETHQAINALNNS